MLWYQINTVFYILPGALISLPACVYAGSPGCLVESVPGAWGRLCPGLSLCSCGDHVGLSCSGMAHGLGSDPPSPTRSRGACKEIAVAWHDLGVKASLREVILGTCVWPLSIGLSGSRLGHLMGAGVFCWYPGRKCTPAGRRPHRFWAGSVLRQTALLQTPDVHGPGPPALLSKWP